MRGQYIKPLMILGLSSLCLLVGATAWNVPAWAAVGAAVVPLIIYHIVFLRRKAKEGLSQHAIDSVYYFGFLITIFALGLSAVALASRGVEGNLTQIAAQFGCGLLATGYAVFARVDLTAVSALADGKSYEETMLAITTRSRELSTNVELASEKFAHFAETLMSKTLEATESSRIRAEQAMVGAASEFGNELRAILRESRDSLAGIKDLVSDAQFESERKELGRSVRLANERLKGLSASIEKITDSVEGWAATVKPMSSQAVELERHFDAISTKLEVLASSGGPLAASAVAFQNVADAAGTSGDTLENVTTRLVTVVTALEETGNSIGNIRAIAARTARNFEILTETCDSLDRTLSQLKTFAELSNQLAGGLEKTTDAFSPLEERARAVCGTLEQVQAAGGRVQLNMEAMAERFARDAESPSERKDKVNTGADATRALSEFTAGLAAMQERVREATEDLKRSIGASAAALEKDVDRSSRAASLLTNSLTKVAQHIIDQIPKKG